MSEDERKIDLEMTRDDQAHELDRLNAWRDTAAWLKLVEGMRADAPDSITPWVETVALSMYAVRRLEGAGGAGGSLARTRFMAATSPDADVMMQLAQASEQSLETTRARRDRILDAVAAIAASIRAGIREGEKVSILGILEALDSIRSL